MSMSSIVLSERPVVGKHQYDLGVYEVAGEFYATWICVECPARGKTEMVATQGKAHADGLAALESHVNARHEA
jgi:hypothetical protein